MVSEAALAERLAELLTGMDGRVTVRGNIVKPGPGTPEIIVSGVEISQPQRSMWIAHADIRFTLNPERSETNIDACATGWGETLEKAVESAAEAWIQTTAPAIFSFLKCSPMHDAAWFPIGDPAGLPGWYVFAGPYVFRGDPGDCQRLEVQLRERPLFPALSQPILGGFDRPLLNYVKLYRGCSGLHWYGDGFINGKRSDALSKALLGLRWPEFTKFASATLFAVAYPQFEPPKQTAS